MGPIGEFGYIEFGSRADCIDELERKMGFSEELVQKIWEHARVADLDADTWRKDECGAWVRREHYGSEHSEFGWKIENVSNGGPDTEENLHAFHHRNTYDHANRRAKCHVTADLAGLDPWEHADKPRNKEV